MVGRSPFSASRSGGFRPENLAQNALIMVVNLCFTVFVIGVLIFTIIAATYNPKDPLFHASSKITKFLSSNSDNGAVKTGEDFVISDQSAFEAFINLTDVNSALAMPELEEEPSMVSENRDCRADDPIDCRDPDVFHLLMKAAIDKFKDIHFYRFGKPVRGADDMSCHMAWRFRPKEGKVAAFNKDYRSFTVIRSEDCTLSVVSIGDYHSGGNARMKKGKAKAKGVFEKMPERADDIAIPLPEIGETENDAFPTIEPFSNRKYLIYSGGGDRCKSMNQYLWSFMCTLGEAQFLNRTLVMDLSLCLSKIYSSFGVDEEGKDFRFYFDFEHLKDSASVLDQARFWSDWNKWQQEDVLSLHLVEDFRVAPMKLAEVKDSLIMRKFGSVEPNNYWYRVCDGETKNVIERPWGHIRKSKRLLDIASAICARMNWDFDCVHVERGEKAKNKKLWPNLDKDTAPESLMMKLKGKVEDGRNLYIATDEEETSFFDPLKGKYLTHFLEEHKDLWAAKSDWYYELMKLNNGNAVEFDGYMKISVDAEVCIRGKKQIETFNDLTRNCKDGINTC